MGLSDRFKKEAMELSQKAMEKLMSDDKRAMKIAAAVGTVQRGKRAFDRGQEEVMRQLNFAPRSDFKAVGKKLSSLKRRLLDLEEKLEALSESKG
jgi:hypothetical protein